MGLADFFALAIAPSVTNSESEIGSSCVRSFGDDCFDYFQPHAPTPKIPRIAAKLLTMF